MIKSAIASLLFASAAFAQTPCDSNACVNVGDTLVFTWAASPSVTPTSAGYNLIGGTTPALLQATAQANLTTVPNFYSVGNALTFSVVTTAALLGQTFWSSNAWECNDSPCQISDLANIVTVRVSAPTKPAAPKTVTVMKK